jgi:enoyl-CoA hydratase/carnithine racemase
MPGTLRVEKNGNLALLTFANPNKRNALDPALLHALVEAVTGLPSQGVRAAVLTAEGDIFSSGYDIQALEGAAPEDRHAQPLQRAISALIDGPLPVVAALPGLAIGGGCELACACDLRVAHAGVALQMPPVRLGLVYPAAGLRRFLALIGASRTREMFLTAAKIPADRALTWGLVDRVVPADQVLACATELATEIAVGSPQAVRGMRRLLSQLQPPLPPATDDALEQLVRAAFDSDDAVEARRAFRERRPPRFGS